MTGARTIGWGVALPGEPDASGGVPVTGRIVTNDDLAARLDTSDEWIRDRTGIVERRIGGTTATLAARAAGAALDRAGLEPGDVDQLVVATTTPDQAVPATAALVQAELDLPAGAVDLNAACAGFVYGLVLAHGLAAVGARRILVVGAETMSRITDWEDRNTAVLFADGAGAVVIEATDGPGELLGWDLGNDGTAAPLLRAPLGGTLTMDGREVFRRAVRATVDSATRALERAGLTAADVGLFVPHQANVRIIDAAGERLGIPRDRTAVVLDRTGNTSAASIPIALADALDRGRVREGEVMLLVGFGAGMSWGSAVLRWGGGS